MALMQAMGPFADGSISNFACNISNHLCTNFGAFIKNCMIDQLIRSTIYYDLSVYKNHDKCTGWHISLKTPTVKFFVIKIDTSPFIHV